MEATPVTGDHLIVDDVFDIHEVQSIIETSLGHAHLALMLKDRTKIS